MREEGEQSLWALSSILTEYKNIFQGHEDIEGKLKLETDLHLKPVRLLKCRVPLALVELLKKELANLQRKSIIASH